MNHRTLLTPAARSAQAQFLGRVSALILLALSLGLCSQGSVLAGGPYSIQPIIRLGDRMGDLLLKADGAFGVGALNDHGQLVFTAVTSTGSQTLIQYDGSKLTPLVVADKEAPGGMWGHELAIEIPVSMNQAGNIVFAANVTAGGSTDEGTYLWDAKLQKVTPVALAGMVATGNLVFVVGGSGAPVVNNYNDIALQASVKNAQGQVVDGVFLSRDGKLQPVAIPDQDLPDGGRVVAADRPSLNDAGVVGVRIGRLGEKADNGYVWEQGTLTPVVVAGAAAPGGGKIATVQSMWVNNKDRSVLVYGRLNDRKVGPEALYRLVDGKLIPVVISGQEMPGGGKFNALPHADTGMSVANDAGQYAFLATLDGNATGAYLMDADGTLSLILKSGVATSLGTITAVGAGAGQSEGVSLNNKGQVALILQIDGGPDTLAVLAPASP
jgi:hypothetical protein